MNVHVNVGLHASHSCMSLASRTCQDIFHSHAAVKGCTVPEMLVCLQIGATDHETLHHQHTTRCHDYAVLLYSTWGQGLDLLPQLLG